MSAEAISTGPVLALEGEITIYAVHSLKERLLAALEDPAGVQLDLSGVSALDYAGLQLLLSARNEALSRDLPFALALPSPPVQQAFGLLGAAGLLGPAGIAAAQETP